MSNADKAKGRADAAKGSYDPPPGELFGGILSSTKANQHAAERREAYREGYNDKRREMGKK